MGNFVGGEFVPKVMFNFEFTYYVHDPINKIKVNIK